MNRIHIPLKLLEVNIKETLNQQLQTSSQQKATKHTQHAPQNNCDTGQPKVAPPTFHNLHDTAQDGAPTHSVRLAKRYIFDATSGDQSQGLIAIILQFLGLNLGESRFKQRFSNQCTSHQLRHYWHPPRKKQQCLQSGVNVGLKPYYSVSGIWHGTS